MQMLESDLERTGRFVALQVEDIKLRSRALAARAAAATAQGELDRIEGAPERGACYYLSPRRRADTRVRVRALLNSRRGRGGVRGCAA